jgi:hypothetical protein
MIKVSIWLPGKGVGECRKKREPPLPAAQGDNREASNRVDRSHSMSKKLDIRSNEGESLIRG